MKRKPVIVTAVITTCICLFVTLMYRTGDSADSYVSAYRYITTRTQPAYVSAAPPTTVQLPSDEDAVEAESGGSSPTMPGIPGPKSDWVSLCAGVHNAMFGISYSQSTPHAVVPYNNTNYKDVRRDCSGYVGFCLYLYGRATTTQPITSRSWKNPTAFGCTTVDKNQGLQQGDIIFYDGHVEVYDHTDGNGKLWVYNRGGKSSCEDNRAPWYSGHKFDEITCVWRIR